MIRLGYNTNGFAHHTLEDAVAILAEIGYESVAVTLERDLLDPRDARATGAPSLRSKGGGRTGQSLQPDPVSPPSFACGDGLAPGKTDCD